MIDPLFIPGRDLARALYLEVVRPLLDKRFPGAPHAAALLGPGSEVLGYDDERSTDHDWGPRLQVFMDARGPLLGEVTQAVSGGLPATFAGYPMRFPDSRSAGAGRPLQHVEVVDVESWSRRHLGVSPWSTPAAVPWLGMSWQRLRENTTGAVFHDGSGVLSAWRARMSWYPPDVWRYVLAAQWDRIGTDEPLVGRCAELGDGPGARMVAARIVGRLWELALLLDSRWPPYSKWLGTAVADVGDEDGLLSATTATLAATTAGELEQHLCAAYTAVVQRQNNADLAGWVDPGPRPFFDRPYRVLGAGRPAEALRTAITDAVVARLPPVGSVDQVCAHTETLMDADRSHAVMRAALAV